METNKWKCEKCERSLPKKGMIWGARFKRHNPIKESSGYYCDCCTSARESGRDY